MKPASQRPSAACEARRISSLPAGNANRQALVAALDESGFAARKLLIRDLPTGVRTIPALPRGDEDIAIVVTHLARAGVDVVTLKTLMRHARIETTLRYYVDDGLLEVDRAVGSLPALLAPSASPESAHAMGTDDARAVALGVALTSSRSRPGESVRVNAAGSDDCGVVDANALPVADSATKAGEREGWLTGLEPATPRITI